MRRQYSWFYRKTNYNEQLNANKWNNVEVDKLPETYHILKLNHEEKEDLNKFITSKEVIKHFTTNESIETDGFTGEFYQTFKKN